MRFKATLLNVLLLGLPIAVVSRPEPGRDGYLKSTQSTAQNVTYIPNTFLVELEQASGTNAAARFAQKLGGK